MTTQSISILSSPNWQRFIRRTVSVILLVSLVVAGRLFLQLENDGSTRWLIAGLCIIATLQLLLLNQPLLGISCYIVLTCYWLLFIVASGSLPLFASAALAGLLGGCVVWQSRLWRRPEDISLITIIFGCSVVTSSFVPASLIVSTTVAVVPFVLLLPLVLTREHCSRIQYLTMLGIIILAAWSVTSSAILFT